MARVTSEAREAIRLASRSYEWAMGETIENCPDSVEVALADMKYLLDTSIDLLREIGGAA